MTVKPDKIGTGWNKRIHVQEIGELMFVTKVFLLWFDLIPKHLLPGDYLRVFSECHDLLCQVPPRASTLTEIRQLGKSLMKVTPIFTVFSDLWTYWIKTRWACTLGSVSGL